MSTTQATYVISLNQLPIAAVKTRDAAKVLGTSVVTTQDQIDHLLQKINDDKNLVKNWARDQLHATIIREAQAKEIVLQCGTTVGNIGEFNLAWAKDIQ